MNSTSFEEDILSDPKISTNLPPIWDLGHKYLINGE